MPFACVRRVSSFASILVALSAVCLAHADDDDETPRPRFAFGASFGYTRTLGDKSQLVQAPEHWPVGSTIGPGLELRVGVQANRWLGFDAELFGDTLLFFGQGRVAALVEVKPVERFAVSAGVGLGQIWEVNFASGFKTANHHVLLLRPDVIWPDYGHNALRLGLELQLGRTTGGSIDAGHTVLGARAVFSTEFH